jgi:hypothetical protein
LKKNPWRWRECNSSGGDGGDSESTEEYRRVFFEYPTVLTVAI